jgi:hypothetical protein
VCDAATNLGLGLDVTFFTGHMSRANWARLDIQGMPQAGARPLVSGHRVVDAGYRNYFTDPVVREAQRITLRAVVGAYKDHPAIWMWNLGNEPDLFAIPPDQEAGREWTGDGGDRQEHRLAPRHPRTARGQPAFTHPQRSPHLRGTDVAVMPPTPCTCLGPAPARSDLYRPLRLTTALCGRATLAGGVGAAPWDRSSETWEWTSMGERRNRSWPRRGFRRLHGRRAASWSRSAPQAP